ncbi:hypothetical protein B296_00056238 [Ensete ventricosum]|uniref:CSN8/PSMD8/EIF3K domain-containing protein n=1 Tax=Ensete ventricosum TaxID=4639 RepID=A0A426XVU5_ENSVE|nr:hypothetical protein B296_00056238 [Ensete ventricosum]
MGREQQQAAYTVEQLVAVNPYNPDILTDLENYVNEQVAQSRSCSLRSSFRFHFHQPFDWKPMAESYSQSIAIYFRFFDGLRCIGYITSIAFNQACVVVEKALMAMPAPDFSLCLFLIPEQVQMEEQIKTLIVLSHYLEVCIILYAVRSFSMMMLTASIQVFLVLNCVFVLRQAINIEGLSLDKFLEYHVANSGWVLEKGHSRSQLMVLPRNEFNHPELKKNTVDGMPFEHVTRIFPILS